MSLIHLVKLFLQPTYRRYYISWRKLWHTPRYKPVTTNILGSELQLVDAASFRSMYKEIFEREIYYFTTYSDTPTIIDCGANIGLSVIYFKRLFPKGHIIAFEPDPVIFAVLEKNLQNFGVHDVELHAQALWSADTELIFAVEGSTGGRVQIIDKSNSSLKVPAARLRPYLQQPVDFLKIDIEGAETEVLQDCADLLSGVQRLFVEYHSFRDQRQRLPELLTVLQNAGFRYYMESTGVSSVQPFQRIEEWIQMDLQLNIFAWQDRK